MANRYNYSLTTFSPTGSLSQIEYALTAVGKGGLTVGIKGKNGVVIATEKKIVSPMIIKNSIDKINLICSSIGMTYSGMGPDARVLLDSVRKTAQKHKMIYGGETPSPIYLVQEVSETIQEYTQKGGVRPFGVSILIAGICEETKEPMLYQIDPSGSYYPWNACSIGKNSENNSIFLEKRYKEDLDIEDVIHLAILALKDGIDGAVYAENIEIGIASIENGKCVFKKLDQEEIKENLDSVEYK